MPNSHIRIRQATQTDLPTLEWDGELIHYRRLFSETYQQARQGQAIIWVAELEQAGLIGQVLVSLKSERPELSDGVMRAYVYGFRVKPRYRSQGVGSQMMAVIEADLRQRGFSIVTLNVGQDNPGARRLYERIGYRVVSPDPGRWSYIDEKGRRINVHEPAWRMEKFINEKVNLASPPIPC